MYLLFVLQYKVKISHGHTRQLMAKRKSLLIISNTLSDAMQIKRC